MTKILIRAWTQLSISTQPHPNRSVSTQIPTDMPDLSSFQKEKLNSLLNPLWNKKKTTGE